MAALAARTLRRSLLLLAATAVLAPAAAAPAAPVRVQVDAFTGSLRSWTRQGPLDLRRRTGPPGSTLRVGLRKDSAGPASLAHRLPGRRWALSLDVRLTPGAAVALRFGAAGSPLRLSRGRGTTVVARAGGWRRKLRVREGWESGGWHHLELIDGARVRLAVDGRSLTPPVRGGRGVRLTLERGALQLAAFVATSATDRGALLFHRLAEIHARTPPGQFPIGTADGGVLRFGRRWTSGFWPGALWQAAALTRGSDLFADWALDATLAHFGDEREDTHDLGFKYRSSSAAAYDRLCAGSRPTGDPSLCRRLRDSALTAADSLLGLAATNAPAGLIPTSGRSTCRGCASAGEADTIIDSVMNLDLLLWAARQTGSERFRDVARRHAAGVARLLVRTDGSTFQSVHVRRSDGAVLSFHTHQGYSETSTWGRGQSWAVYGFARTARQLRSPELLAVAERIAGYIERRLPAGAIPPWDYNAPAGAPADTSAGVIAAAGLFELARACARVGGCADPARWTSLAKRILAASLARLPEGFPLGLLPGQIGNRPRPADAEAGAEAGEYVFGLYYALDAIRRAGYPIAAQPTR